MICDYINPVIYKLSDQLKSVQEGGIPGQFFGVRVHCILFEELKAEIFNLVMIVLLSNFHESIRRAVSKKWTYA